MQRHQDLTLVDFERRLSDLSESPMLNAEAREVLDLCLALFWQAQRTTGTGWDESPLLICARLHNLTTTEA